MRKAKFRLDFLDGHQAVTFEGYDGNGLCLAVSGEDHSDVHLHLDADQAEAFYDMLGMMIFGDGRQTKPALEIEYNGTDPMRSELPEPINVDGSIRRLESPE